LLSIFALKGNAPSLSDVLLLGSRAYIGRVEFSGPDVELLDISNPRAISVIGQFGENGAGEHLALSGSDVFIESVQLGLRRIRFGGTSPALIATWGISGDVSGCQLSAPTQPQPPNNAEVPDGMVTLTWASTCNADAYEVRIEGTLVATETSAAYTFTPNGHHIGWQITAVDAAGNRAEGPTWTFDTTIEGWLATPVTVPGSKLLYTPSILSLPSLDLHAPGAVIAATCIALAAGLMIVVGAAWLIGTRVERSSRKL
jgi:hypothetical protein